MNVRKLLFGRLTGRRMRRTVEGSADARAYQPVGSCAYPSEFQPGTSLRRGTG
jgi:hypothetical protein